MSAPEMPRQMRALIGDVIMIGAELDQLVSMSLFRMTELRFFDGFVLLDRTAISTKFKRLQYLVEATEDVQLAERVDEIGKRLLGFSRIRNTLAHGVYFQRTSGEQAFGFSNDFHFAVTSDYVTEGGSFGNRVSQYNIDELATVVRAGRALCLQIRETFRVGMLHELSPGIPRSDRPMSPTERRKRKTEKQKPRPSKSQG